MRARALKGSSLAWKSVPTPNLPAMRGLPATSSCWRLLCAAAASSAAFFAASCSRSFFILASSASSSASSSYT